MQMRTLFDEKRRDEVRKALAEGRPIFQRKKTTALPEPVSPPLPEPAPTQETGAAPAISRYPQFSVKEKVRMWAEKKGDDLLVAALRKGDFCAAEEALRNGADTNAEVYYSSQTENGGGCGVTRMLSIAKESNRMDLQKLLERYGAR